MLGCQEARSKGQERSSWTSTASATTGAEENERHLDLDPVDDNGLQLQAVTGEVDVQWRGLPGAVFVRRAV